MAHSQSAQALVLAPGGGAATIEQITVRGPREHEVLVKERAAGVCRSDLHLVDGDWSVEERTVPGHEASRSRGAVRACTDSQPGANRLPDGTTASSSDDEPVHPFVGVGVGVGVGAFSEYIGVPEVDAIAIPEELPFVGERISPDGVASAFEAMRRGTGGRTVVIFG